MDKLEQKFKGKEFLIRDKETGELEKFEIAKIFHDDRFASYGILLENPYLVLRVTGYSNGSFSINNSLGETYEIPKQTQEELKAVLN